jgi:predicted HTH transcriptional regulator
MTLHELPARVALDEDNRRQFNQDMQSPDALAAEMVAFANSDGGAIFLGVADDGSLPGLNRTDVSRLNLIVSNVAAQHVRSPLPVQTGNMELEHGRLVADFCPSACYTYLHNTVERFIHNYGALCLATEPYVVGASDRTYTPWNSRYLLLRISQC